MSSVYPFPKRIYHHLVTVKCSENILHLRSYLVQSAYLCKKICSGIHPVNTQRSVPELLPGKSYPPLTFIYAFSTRAGHRSCGLRRSSTCKHLADFEAGRRSSITTRRKQPLKFSRRTYLPLGDGVDFLKVPSKGYIMVDNS